MKIHTIKNRWFLPVLSCAALAMTSHSQAAVIVTFKQAGPDVVATWSGSLNAGSWSSDFTDVSVVGAVNSWFFGLSGDYEIYSGGVVNLTGLDGLITAFTGSAGFDGGLFYVGGINDDIIPGSSIYNFDTLGVSQTFGNQTLVDIGATSFNNTLAWTSSLGGTNTISYTTIPEPSSTALIGLGALALAVRGRR